MKWRFFIPLIHHWKRFERLWLNEFYRRTGVCQISISCSWFSNNSPPPPLQPINLKSQSRCPWTSTKINLDHFTPCPRKYFQDDSWSFTLDGYFRGKVEKIFYWKSLARWRQIPWRIMSPSLMMLLPSCRQSGLCFLSSLRMWSV